MTPHSPKKMEAKQLSKNFKTEEKVRTSRTLNQSQTGRTARKPGSFSAISQQDDKKLDYREYYINLREHIN